ncbi:MAG TPA: TonB-dependent receptor, partial [Erythrobacter sp.]|nr:TonB-dependent receptor [Erythrobacter sp.]
RATNSTLTAFIRGVGQQDPVSGFEQGVGIYLDDVYLNRPQAAVLDVYDVERNEVLRGPQGTLYGRNTIGGSVKYVTKQLPDDFSMKIKGTLGTYDQADGIVTVSGPISDQVRLGGSVARLSRGGFGDNPTTGLENYNKDVWAARASLELGGKGEPVLVRISGDYTRDKSNPRGGHRLIPGMVSGIQPPKDVFDTLGGINDPVADVEAYGLSMNLTAELSDMLTLRSISSWRKDDSEAAIDFDSLPAVDVDVPGAYYNEQLSQEFQLLLDAGPLQGLMGFYYLDAKADTLFDVRLWTTFANLYPMLTGITEANVDTETYAVFADFTYDISDMLSLSVGGRYTWDERSARILKQSAFLGGSGNFGDAGLVFSTDTDFDGNAKFKKFTPRASISFKPNSDHNIYASYSQGFKGGGFDPRGAGKNANDLDNNGSLSDDEIAAYLSFAPESVDSYEIGYKGNLMGGDLYVATALFRMDYTDVQIPGSVACTLGGVPSFCGVVSNAGKARIQGFELEANAKLARDLATAGDRLSLSGSFGYIDAEYKKYETFVAGSGTVDVSEYRKVQNTPKVTASGSLNYSTPAGDGMVNFGTTLSYRSKTYQFEIPNPYIDQDGYALLDASLVYTAPDNRWSIGIHGKNLTNKHYKTSGYTYMNVNPVTGEILLNSSGNMISGLGNEGVLTAFYGNPRQVFVTGTLNF